MQIQSYKGVYTVEFESLFKGLEKGLAVNEHLLIDARVAELYSQPLEKALASDSIILIEAIEHNKSLDRIPFFIQQLIEQGIRRESVLVAVGGGIIQDIASFISGILFRGVPWRFYPTTLLAQADSCIGSKSSINLGQYKNQIGNFTPPSSIHIGLAVLKTLDHKDLLSGVGEILKVHLLSGTKDFDDLSSQYAELLSHSVVLEHAILRSLEIKKAFIERDEFDQNDRLLLNYGHSFGHAIESATEYQIPHGIAVTIGMDMANFVSWKFGAMPEQTFHDVHAVLKRNFAIVRPLQVPMDRFLDAISKDKKNTGKTELSLILLDRPGVAKRNKVPNDRNFQNLCREYFSAFGSE